MKKITELKKQRNDQFTFYQACINKLTNCFDTLIKNLNKIKKEYKKFKANYNQQSEIGLLTIKELVRMILKKNIEVYLIYHLYKSFLNNI